MRWKEDSDVRVNIQIILTSRLRKSDPMSTHTPHGSKKKEEEERKARENKGKVKALRREERGREGGSRTDST